MSRSFSSLSDSYGLDFDFILNHSEERKAGSQGSNKTENQTLQATHKIMHAKARQPDNSITATNQTFLSGKETSSKVQNGTIILSVGARGLGNAKRHS